MPHHSIPSDDAGQMRLNAGLDRSRSAETHSQSYGLSRPGAAKAARPGQFRRIWTSQRRDRARAGTKCTFTFTDKIIGLLRRFN